MKYYTNDLEDDLIQECVHKTAECAVKPGSNSLLSLSTFLRNQSLPNVYPNLDIALRIAFSTPATNCSGERSFSCLKRVKNYQRSSLFQEKMNSLTLLGIEAEIINTINYDDFAIKKSRKKLYILFLFYALNEMENYYFRKVCTWGGGNKLAYTHKKYKSGTA